MTTDLILGTAGHIDHGKTSLIRALTGVDTDRLPEEKRRGITIELGFAELVVGDYRLGIVDVPGHERFVRNMLCGATGMDLAMLVVAADDSVKQQTREHLEILRLLDLPGGLIALTKCDVVDGDWIDMVEAEIRQLVAGTFLADAPIVRTSAVTGAGLDELRGELAAVARRVASARETADASGPFRMAIDRTFTVAGHGTVVTGSIHRGTVCVGDELEIQPAGIPVRVRGVQNHDRTVEEAHRGQRAAINLAGVHHDGIGRGDELATTGYLRPSRLLSVSLQLLPTAKPLKTRSRVRLHVGTAELMASVVLIGTERLEPGQTAPAQLFLSAPAVTCWRQPLVIRSESPVTTIGGGRVLVPNAEKLRRADECDLRMLDRLLSPDRIERAAAAVYFAGLRGFDPTDLARTAGIEDVAGAARQLAERGELREIRVSPTRTLRVHPAVLDKVRARLAAALATAHEKNPLRMTVDRVSFLAAFRYLGEESLIQAVLEDMQSAGQIRLSEKGIARVGHGPKLSQNERKLMTQLVEQLRQAGIQAPFVKECQQAVARGQQSIPHLLALAAAEGELVEINAEYYLHRDVEQSVRQSLVERLRGGSLTLSEIRETLNTTRKFAVPLCEYLDRIGFTRRDGDVRTLATEQQA